MRAEMYTGAGRNRSLITRLNQVLADLDGAPIVREDGTLAGRLLGRLGPGKRTVSLVDALLAAAAERRGAVVLTGDPHDFQRLRDEAGCRVTFAVI